MLYFLDHRAIVLDPGKPSMKALAAAESKFILNAFLCCCLLF